MAATRTKTPRKKSKRQTLIDRMERAGPTREQLREIAKKRRPPQSWYDQTDNPFEPESK